MFKVTIAATTVIIAAGTIAYHKSDSTLRSDEQYLEVAKLRHRLKPLHQPMDAVQPGDWLESHHESGQSLRQYVRANPIRLTKQRDTLYVLPLGAFNESQEQIVKLSAEFLSICFGCKVEMLDRIGLEVIPTEARRHHPSWGMRQLLSTYILKNVLEPRLPDDAVALIAFTTSDLWPGEGWNFVFGQAALRERVGVWSIYRNGDPTQGDLEYKTCLMRTLKTAAHETGHMFSIKHCLAYECNMCGSNNREESDRRDIYMCPDCVAKIWYSTNCDPRERFKRLQEFFEDLDLDKESAFYKKSLEALK